MQIQLCFQIILIKVAYNLFHNTLVYLTWGLGLGMLVVGWREVHRITACWLLAQQWMRINEAEDEEAMKEKNRERQNTTLLTQRALQSLTDSLHYYPLNSQQLYISGGREEEHQTKQNTTPHQSNANARSYLQRLTLHLTWRVSCLWRSVEH